MVSSIVLLFQFFSILLKLFYRVTVKKKSPNDNQKKR